MSDDGSARRDIDLAMGVLIGWQGCSPQEAFGELVDAVRDTGVPLSKLAGAVVALASGSQDIDDRAGAVAAQHWGELRVRVPVVRPSRNIH